jgi:hypothetical protein
MTLTTLCQMVDHVKNHTNFPKPTLVTAEERADFVGFKDDCRTGVIVPTIPSVRYVVV